MVGSCSLSPRGMTEHFHGSYIHNPRFLLLGVNFDTLRLGGMLVNSVCQQVFTFMRSLEGTRKWEKDLPTRSKTGTCVYNSVNTQNGKRPETQQWREGRVHGWCGHPAEPHSSGISPLGGVFRMTWGNIYNSKSKLVIKFLK